jgi:hypothetical protein
MTKGNDSKLLSGFPSSINGNPDSNLESLCITEPTEPPCPGGGGHKYRDLVLQVWGLDAGLTTLLCIKIIFAKSKEVKTGHDLTESSKEGSLTRSWS